MSTPTGPALEVKHVSLSFKGVKAISDLSFQVERQEICALIGPNGAGKSSLLNILNGVYVPDSGEIVFEGEHFRRMQPLEAARRGIGRGFQNNALFSGMSVLDNVIAGLSRHSKVTLLEEAFRLPRALKQERDFRERAQAVLHLFDLEKHAAAIVGTLPYGVQKKVEIARAVVGKPRLLLLDEPLAGMNAEEKQEIAAVIARLNTEMKLTIVLIEHDIGIVLKLAHHVVVLDYGRKLADGLPETIRDNPDVIAAYLGSDHKEIAA
ncbi:MULTISPECIES: ABC transporter ATP-binding protein [Rhizobium/Agrobacterium group]|uniref:ABC transporter nucleotide binding/ATPase protein (Branched chain amino acid) n=2 Tax=Rhizobium/Agrobacterium group TaxID=227290 RepID=B9K4R4_ALLAM|nr:MULTISPECIES: ABC transporter ATP-binding protein [Rhizobium/Agrobacterium group]ACM39862.1 ABC transporter nucleotide binding/ATPase protein (branched chain amino acid) [Allorhizobium ampelinum S4]MCF1447977.1 ABC transporter ATP-binding protein [Allorhizobium ampelinum]MCF1495265.1 ABC transporter ATP-binding protein [Allorhizobium ampelinum]MUO28649.1 ATP-binding cassette domain-containing protein [Agrobacterium vitis]MUO41550.1 ATP-binding cassette domain-containing protein [Agrobacteri